MYGIWAVIEYRSSDQCGTKYNIVHVCQTKERATKLCYDLMEHDIEDYNWHDIQYLKVTK